MAKLEALNMAVSKLSAEIVSIRTAADLNAKNASTAALAIEKFREENETLIKLAEIEKPIIMRNAKYLAAYDSFREKLLQYNAYLPLSVFPTPS